MNAALAIFVKTPGLSPLKTRLAEGIGEDQAHAFYRLSLNAVSGVVQSTDFLPHWAVAEEQGLQDPLWSAFPAIHTGKGCLGERQHRIYERLLSEHACVLLIGADTPQISSDIIHSAVRALKDYDFVIGPAHDGGYYLFGGKVSLGLNVWTCVAWSTEKTCALLEAGLPSEVFRLPYLTDVDTENDLPQVLRELPEAPSKAQRSLKTWIEEL